jgi:uncharacterized membrane protein YgcG
MTLAAAMSTAQPAVAAEISSLDGPVTDRTGVLDGSVGEIETAIEDLLDEANVQLWVLFVPTTEDLNATDYATEAAAANSLGANDALLVVAIDDRTDAIWVADGLDGITDAEIDAVIANDLEPRLADGDFGGAVVATAEGLGAAATAAEPTPRPVVTPGAGSGAGPDGESGEEGGTGILGLVLVVIGIVVVAFAGLRWLGTRLTSRREAEERDRRTGKLAREANALLVASDERIRTAQQEVGYVEAAYGPDETAPLRAALAQAQQELRGAFEIRQRLDDAEPETPADREAMLAKVVTHAQTAQAALDREAERIRQLRDLERDAPTVLAELAPKADAVEARLPAADGLLAELTRGAPAAVAPVQGNLEEARKGLAGARAAIRAGEAALAKEDRRTAAKQARTAMVGIDGAAVLVDAIENLAASVREANARVPQELEAARAGIAEARTTSQSPVAALAGRSSAIDAAEDALRAATASLSAGDPIAALRAATEAHRTADAAVSTVRQAALESSRLVATADASLAAAQADIDRAADFIAARRSGVGRTARTRLAEAERHYEAAFLVRDTDPEQTIGHARRAEQLAEQAYALADRDFTDFNGGGFGGTGLPSRGGNDALGAILGGIIGGVLSGGGRGGGWGGSPWGSSGPFGGGGGWGGGGGRGGPFGGGGGFGGGGFGGGGGRSRGGRW